MVDSNEQKRIRQAVKRQNLKRKPKLSRKTAGSFNFAAFFLPVIYNMSYKRYSLAFTIMFLTLLPHFVANGMSPTGYKILVILETILAFILVLYAGFTGNLVAYESRDYDDEEDFLKSQKFWTPFVITAAVIHLIVFPSQINGHKNIVQMLRFADAKKEIDVAVMEKTGKAGVLGYNVLGEDVPIFLSKGIDGIFDGKDTIKAYSGKTYKIEGYRQECGKLSENTYYEQKTSCATISINTNTGYRPNTSREIDRIKRIYNPSVKLGDNFTLYLYENGTAPKEGSIEQWILKRFERKI